MNTVFFLTILLSVLGKILFNDEGAATGRFSANWILYVNGFCTAAILIAIILLKSNKIKYELHGLYKLCFCYYIYALVSTAYSDIPVLSLYHSITGVLYVVASLVISETIAARNDDLNIMFNRFIRFICIFSFVSLLANYYFQVTFGKIGSLMTSGLPSGYIVMFILYIVFLLNVHNPTIKKRLVSVAIFLAATFLNSFSAYISFFVMLLAYFLIKKKYLLFMSLAGAIFSTSVAFVAYLEANIGHIVLNKTAGAYLTGSGRFKVYEVAFNVFANEFDWIDIVLGKGFMAERIALLGHGLTWTIDPHNALILNALGLGLVGMSFFLIFLVYPFVFFSRVKRIEKLNRIASYWLCFHIMASVYSVSSSYYLGRPSFVLLFSLVFYNLIYKEYSKYRSGRVRAVRRMCEA